MRIPEIKARLETLAEEHGISELSDLAAELTRRSPVRRAPITSTPFTDELRREIRSYARCSPRMPYSEIASHFRVNQGRVSEAMAGERR